MPMKNPAHPGRIKARSPTPPKTSLRPKTPNSSASCAWASKPAPRPLPRRAIVPVGPALCGKPRNFRSQTLPVPLLAAFTFSRRCFSIQSCIESSVRLRRRLTAYINIAVIRIPAVAMLPPFQFLIERIQVDVGQQRRQRTALRRPFLACFHHPFYHRSPPQVLPDQLQHPFVPDHCSRSVPSECRG